PFGQREADALARAGDERPPAAEVEEGEGHATPRASRASTSARAGMEGAVPGRVTEMPATAQPKRTAARGSMPRARAEARPPLKASPAPVVSTTGPASTAGTSSDPPAP